MRPCFSLQPARRWADTSCVDLPDDATLDAQLARLGYGAFRPGQREAIHSLFEHSRLLLVAPTGQGKSLSYQLPACLLPGVTLVVSPLISLMHDQVRGLTERGVPATYLASTLDADESRARYEEIRAGRYRLVYVAPERLGLAGFRRMLAQLSCSLLVVDEAHCISEWGHDFRPEYLQIGELVRELPSVRVLACTATATPVVRDEILARLGLPASTPQMVRGFARPNLALRAAEVDSARDGRALVDELLRESIGFPSSGKGAAIIYSPTRRRAEQEAQRLTALGGRVGVYHAGLPGEQRQRAQSAFSRGDLDVVVATNAFGMGIDRHDVRAVVHLAPPGSVEAYYQEVGRAGRDGEPATGLLLVSSQDIPLRRRLIESSNDGPAPEPAVVEHKWQLFLELMRWVEGGSCRHDAILRYFGDEAETLDGCGRCDVCQELTQEPQDDPEEVQLLVRKALSGVARLHGRFGLTRVVHLLAGKPDPQLQRSGLDQVSTFGALKAHDEAWLTRLLRRCITAGWVSFSGDERPVVLLTPAGRAVMRGEQVARLLLPRRGVTRAAAPRPGVARAVAPRSGGARPGTTEGLDPLGLRLFEALRAHRLELSQREGVPPYVIASDRTLRDLSVLRPRSRPELLAVYGIGPAKVERYGDSFLRVLSANEV
jgi:ATP-dependent DNA helicase RecQ